jgi:tRNA(Arg) A34 adenosine deaminase TadA
VNIAAEDRRFGACGSALQVCGDPRLNHVPLIHFGSLREEASSMLSSFFQNIREKRK